MRESWATEVLTRWAKETLGGFAAIVGFVCLASPLLLCAWMSDQDTPKVVTAASPMEGECYERKGELACFRLHASPAAACEYAWAREHTHCGVGRWSIYWREPVRPGVKLDDDGNIVWGSQ